MQIYINIHAHRLEAGLLTGTKRPCKYPLATDWFTFGRETHVYMPIGRRPEYFRV